MDFEFPTVLIFFDKIISINISNFGKCFAHRTLGLFVYFLSQFLSWDVLII
jgi:hypothetical protein